MLALRPRDTPQRGTGSHRSKLCTQSTQRNRDTEEPDVLVALVRVCGGAVRVTCGSTRRLKPPIAPYPAANVVSSCFIRLRPSWPPHVWRGRSPARCQNGPQSRRRPLSVISDNGPISQESCSSVPQVPLPEKAGHSGWPTVCCEIGRTIGQPKQEGFWEVQVGNALQ